MTTTRRDSALDLLRALALLRVFLWHATGWEELTWLAALPLMFFLTGTLMREGIERRGTASTLQSRTKRMLLPYWVFGAVMLTATAVTTTGFSTWLLGDARNIGWALPFVAPEGPDWQQGWVTEPLWYIRTYLWLLLLTPLLALLRGKRYLTALAGVMALSVVLLETVLGTHLWAVQDLALYGVFYTLGYAWKRGENVLGRGSRAGRWAAAATLLTVAIAYYVNRTPENGVINNSHTLHLLLGGASLILGLSALGVLGRVAARPTVSRVLRTVSGRSLTIYLWHAPMIGLSYLLVGLIPGVDSRGELVRTLIATGVAVICTALAVSAVGMVEDVAAGRASVGMKRLRMVSGGALLVVAGLTVHASAGATLDLPPTPSKAPEQADFSVAPEESFLLVPESGVVPEIVTPDASSSSQHSPSTRVPVGADSAERRAPGNRTPGTTAPGTTAPGTTAPGTTAPVTTPEKPAGAVAITPVAAWENLAEEADEITRSEIVAMMRSWLLENNNGGLELAVVKPGKTRLTAAVNAKGESVEVADMIPLASVTKSYTTALLLRAADNGLLSLDQKVGPLSAAPWFTLVNDTTVGELLSHSSGLHNYTDTDVYREDWRKINGWESALQAVEAEGLLFAPGSKVEYSSTNFVVAGLLAAQIYGRPVEDLIRQELLSPLGLNRSVVGPPGPGAPGTGTGNMSAHITDVARWAKAMWRDKSVLNEYGNSLAAYTNPKHLLGYGSFAWCPCTTQRGKTIPAAMGHNGAELTMRYYAATDTILVLRVTGGVPANIEPLITSILSRVK